MGGQSKELQYAGGSQMDLQCRVSSTSTKVTVRWTKDGRYLLSTGEAEDFLFTVNDVSSVDSGRYMCEANNHAGSTNFTFIVQVEGNVFNIR